MESTYRPPSAWLLVFAVLLGEFLFGATRFPLGADRYDLRCLFAGTTLVFSALVLLLSDPEHRPPGRWLVAACAFPVWIALQSIPLPRGLVGALSPSTLRWTDSFWPGPLGACGEPALIAAHPPGWLKLALDSGAAGQLLVRVFASALIFLAARTFFSRDRERTGKLLLIVALFTGAEAAYGLTQWATGSGKLLWAIKPAYLDCATGTLVNRNHFAQMLYLGLGCTLSLLARRRQEGFRGLRAERETAIRVFLASLLALQLAGILTSKSRAGIGGALLVLLPSLPLLLKGRTATRLLAAAVIALLAIPTLLLVGPALVERVGNIPVEWTSTQGRGAVLRTSLGLVQEFPAFGTGAGSFEWVFATQRPPEILGRYNYAHNDYLQVLMETGIIGLCLALLPVALLAWELSRRWRRGRRPRNIPLLLALAAVVLHEFVDFGLQTPGNAALLAILAGAAFPTPRLPGSRWGQLVAALALLAAVPAALMSIALWSGLQTRLPWPKMADAYHAAANLERESWREAPEDGRLLCRALELEVEAQRLRPLSAYLPMAQAKMTVEGMSQDLVGSALHEEDISQIPLLTGRARRLDPWNSEIRQQLMGISLATGDIDLALDDALAAARRNPVRAKSIAKVLLRAGLPPVMLARALSSEPLLLQGLIDLSFEKRDFTTLGELVPREVAPTPGTCEIGGRIANVLRRVHKQESMPFLEGCLALAEQEQDGEQVLRVRAWMVRALLVDKRWDRAAALLEELPRSPAKNSLRFDLARGQEDWKGVIRAGRTLLDSRTPIANRRREARIRATMAEAYAHLDRFEQALRQLRAAARLAPYNARYERLLRRMQQGENPFER